MSNKWIGWIVTRPLDKATVIALEVEVGGTMGGAEPPDRRGWLVRCDDAGKKRIEAASAANGWPHALWTARGSEDWFDAEWLAKGLER